MASLKKLSIWGIRSFGSELEDKQVITFDKHLTLILGDNGCGKSTIIECLRYVTAQREPSGKGVFVHDPNLTGSASVKARVILEIRDSKNVPVNLSKALQATRTRKAITTKSLDSSITYKNPDGNELITLSGRCADFEPKVMRILGVSKAILENVIFCTQDEAHWPLDSDLKVKEKFDQIFDSEKYNKCLKKVRDKRNDLLHEKKTRETELKYLKENKSASSRKLRELKDLENDVSRFEAEIETINQSLKPIEEQLKGIDEKERELSKVHTTRETTRTELAGVERAEKELNSKIQKACCEFIGSDDDLKKALDNCDLQSRNVNELKISLVKLKEKEVSITNEKNKSLGKKGQLTKMIELNKEKLSEKEQKILKLGKQCGMTSSNVTEDDIDRILTNKKRELCQLQLEHESKEDTLQSQVEKARDNVINKEGDVKRKEGDLQENLKERAELKKEMDNAEASQMRRKNVCLELQAAEKSLSEHQRSASSSQLSEKLQQCQNELKECELKFADAENDVKRLQEDAEIGSKLELKRSELTKKTAEMRRLRNFHQDTLISILGSEPESGYKRAVERHGEKLSANLRELREKKTALEGKEITLKSASQSMSDSLQKKNSELQIFMGKVNEQTFGEDLNITVEKLETSLNELQDKKGVLAASQYMYNSYIKELERAEPCCPLCKRDFAAEEESRKLVELLSKKKREVPSSLEEVNKNLQEEQDKLRLLFALQPQQEKMAKLKNEEIPALTKGVEEKRHLVLQVRKELAEAVKSLQSLERDKESCTSILGDMALLDQLIMDHGRLKLEVDNLQKQLPAEWSIDLLKDAETLKTNLLAKRKRLYDEREQTQLKLNEYNEILLKLQNKKHCLAEEELKLRSSGGQRQQQEDRLTTLQNLEAVLRAEIDLSRAAVLPVEKAHAKLVRDLKELKEKNKNNMKEEQKELDRLLEQLKDIRRLQNEISNFERRGEENELDNLNRQIKVQEDDLKALKVQIDSINAKLGDLSKSVVRRRELEDNKALREKQREKDQLKIKLQELNTKFGDMNYNALVVEKKKLKNEEDRLAQKKANLNGKLGAIEGQMESLKKELKSPMYLNIDAKFKEELVEMRIAEALACDLLRYATAMDYAMNVYHTQQMERVNSIVREYWRKIYRGNDVDYIEVATEQAEATEKRRSFNYKLVQVKGDVRLDMRNRCSAGQKMLASLIIRMALAEVFSNNCGILTLDEPTTNLDRKNIRNLANTLNELIATKQSLPNTNFQLIVITHDKDFLNELISVNAVEKYVEVSRNRDGKSQLKVLRVSPT